MSKPLTMTEQQEFEDRATRHWVVNFNDRVVMTLSDVRERAYVEVDALRAALAAAEAKLADERRHADALVEALTTFMWAASPEQHGGTSAYPYEELRDLLAAHAARRAAAAPLSDAGASSEVANGTA